MVDSNPSGLRAGPVSTRATKPYVSGIRIHAAPVAAKVALMSIAPKATMRADVSFTGWGNGNGFRMRFTLGSLL